MMEVVDRGEVMIVGGIGRENVLMIMVIIGYYLCSSCIFC